MKTFLIILLLLNATLILGQEYDCGENYNHIRIGAGIMLTEQFKPIKNYEGLYEISNFGRVKSLPKEKWNHYAFVHLAEKILMHNISPMGYHRITLHKDGELKTFQIHLLVWDHFGNSPRNGFILQVDHADNDKNNCGIDNLQLLTSRENIVKYQKMRDNITSKYIGVSWHKQCKKWQAEICIDSKSIHLGTYNKEIEASNAYQNKLAEITNV